MMTDDDDMFSRWSRRKRAVAEEEAQAVVPAAEPEPEVIAEPETEMEEAALLERLDLPVPESMKAGDDFSVFMKAGVPEFLKKRALRVLWRSNPVLACVDGLNDYDDDFTSPELTQKVLATAYKVGKGIVFDEPDEEDAPEAENEILAEIEGGEESEPGISEDELLADDGVVENAAQKSTAAESEEDVGNSFHPRRMRFST